MNRAPRGGRKVIANLERVNEALREQNRIIDAKLQKKERELSAMGAKLRTERHTHKLRLDEYLQEVADLKALNKLYHETITTENRKAKV